MHVYTSVQIIGLAILYIVSAFKSIALVFPFFVLLMLPLRWSLNYLPKISLTRKWLAGKVFNASELEAVSISIWFILISCLLNQNCTILIIFFFTSFDSLMEKMLENLYEMETKKNKNMKTAQNKKLETLYTFTPLLIKHTTCIINWII